MLADEALALIREVARPVTAREDVPLGSACGRILAEDVVATVDVPPHANAAVDGYAFCFDDHQGPDKLTSLPITRRIPAGEAPCHPLGRGEAARIFTGAPMPAGSDTVAMQENVQLDGANVILPANTRRGANRRHAGEDVTRGSIILNRGRRLRATDVGLAASAGLTSVTCRTPLNVAVFSTGNEVTEPGQELQPGKIYDANRYAVRALLDNLDCNVTDFGILPDDAETTRKSILTAARNHQVLMTSGGVSVGDEDHVQRTVREHGVLHAWYMAIKPGRPLVLGEIGDSAFVGLPGNPAAAIVTFLRFARPLLLLLAGASEVEPLTYRVRSGFERRKKGGRREYVRVHLQRARDGELEAQAFRREGAGILASLVETDGLAELPEAMTQLFRGDMIDVLPFSEVMS